MTLNDNCESSEVQSSRSTEHFEFRTRPRGVLDIAFTVDDIEAVCLYILAHGGDIIGQTMNAVAGHPAVHCYTRDPEGNVLHLAENRGTPNLSTDD
jgi:predicted enzyme related to lactoylglutathione lyase